MAFSQIATSVTIISSGLKGYQAVSLTEFNTSAESSIAAGSAVEISNAFFLNASDLAVTGFSSITTGNTCYIALTPAGTAGSQTLSAAWTETAPVWDDSKQGWYASAASTVRYVAGTTKTGTSSSEPDFILPKIQADTTGGMRIPGDFDVGGSVTIGGSASITSTASSAGFQRSGYIHNDSATENDIFDAIATAIPTTNNSVVVSGILYHDSINLICAMAVRINATTVRFYGYNNVAPNGAATINVVDGTATSINYCSIAW